MEKYHKQEVSPVEEENERDETFEADNPQIDSKRTKNNYHMNSNAFGGYTEFINKRLKELGLKPRKDAVVMNSFVVGSDKVFFDGLSKIQRYNFFSDCTKFFEERYGKENVMSAVVHLDETTPHMHLNLIPITTDGRLCSKDLFDKPKLQQLQTDFYEAVGKKYGLQRGKEGSQAKHLSTAEYKAKKIIEEAEEIRRENQVYADALEEAKNGEIPKKRGKLQEQVIALTVANKDLTERLDRRYPLLLSGAGAQPGAGKGAFSQAHSPESLPRRAGCGLLRAGRDDHQSFRHAGYCCFHHGGPFSRRHRPVQSGADLSALFPPARRRMRGDGRGLCRRGGVPAGRVRLACASHGTPKLGHSGLHDRRGPGGAAGRYVRRAADDKKAGRVQMTLPAFSLDCGCNR